MKMKNLVSKTVNMSVASLSLATVSLNAFAAVVPEPSILGLIGIGVAVLIVAKIRRK